MPASAISSTALLTTALFYFVQSVPFYLYEGPAFDWLGNCSTEYRTELDARRKAMHGGEVLFLDQIVRSSERVTEANVRQAQVFVVPTLLIFGACPPSSLPFAVPSASKSCCVLTPAHTGLDHGDEQRWRPTDDTCSGKLFKEMQTETANALLASPHFRASGGLDHLLVADSYKLWDMERNSDFSVEFLKVQPYSALSYSQTNPAEPSLI